MVSVPQSDLQYHVVGRAVRRYWRRRGAPAPRLCRNRYDLESCHGARAAGRQRWIELNSDSIPICRRGKSASRLHSYLRCSWPLSAGSRRWRRRCGLGHAESSRVSYRAGSIFLPCCCWINLPGQDRRIEVVSLAMRNTSPDVRRPRRCQPPGPRSISRPSSNWVRLGAPQTLPQERHRPGQDLVADAQAIVVPSARRGVTAIV